MTGRALTLAIRLLCTSAAAAAAVTLPGCCGIGYDPWADTEVLDLETDVDLHAIARVPHDYTAVAVGAGGTVIAWGDHYAAVHMQVGENDLHAVWVDGSAWWVVGDAGTAAVSVDQGLTWTTVDLGTTANLRGITSIGTRLVVVGDGVVVLQGADGIWAEVPAPEAGWGDLQAVHHDGSRVYVVGRAGKAWSAVDPNGEWQAEAVGTSVDLFDMGSFQGAYDEPPQPVIVGAAGTMLVRDGSGWKDVRTRIDVDSIAYEDGGVLAAGGGLYEVTDKLRLRHVDTLGGALAMVYEEGYGALAVGTDGVAYDKPYYYCKGGRPFVVDGESITAKLRAPTRSAATSEVEAALARAWADDGLVEHASVASFARFALELLALGAPPALLREVHVAVADELRHAKLCFGLARRFGGVPVGPGALSMPAGVLARSGDPVATALALFEEGCVNESLAACEAADAAEAGEDAEVRDVLENIAADERRHATLAWAALRWLIDTHGERVRAPLRARLARLESRPSTRVHRRVIAELISPLGRALLQEVA